MARTKDNYLTIETRRMIAAANAVAKRGDKYRARARCEQWARWKAATLHGDTIPADARFSTRTGDDGATLAVFTFTVQEQNGNEQTISYDSKRSKRTFTARTMRYAERTITFPIPAHAMPCYGIVNPDHEDMPA
jgi:hypothetical protein